MKKRVRVGIVGCGAIGSSLAGFVAKDFSSQAQLAALYDSNAASAAKLARRLSLSKPVVMPSFEKLISRVDLVIESASAAVSRTIAREALAAGKDVLIMSVGGVVSGFPQLSALAKKRNARIFIPSGAICGIDGLKAMRFSKIKSVVLTTTKNPRGFSGNAYVAGKKIDLGKLKKDTVLFSGSAAQAIRYFPQNINVAGILSLAGIGADKTRVRIIASPKATKNIHEIKIVSDSGTITTRTENVVHPSNPKTSYLAVLAAAATLRQIFAPARLGS